MGKPSVHLQMAFRQYWTTVEIGVTLFLKQPAANLKCQLLISLCSQILKLAQVSHMCQSRSVFDSLPPWSEAPFQSADLLHGLDVYP